MYLAKTRIVPFYSEQPWKSVCSFYMTFWNELIKTKKRTKRMCLNIMIWSVLLIQTSSGMLNGYRRHLPSGPLQTLGPNPTLIPNDGSMSRPVCGSLCSMDSICTGFSYHQGSCWIGLFHPFYIPQIGDVDHAHPFWVVYYSNGGEALPKLRN